MIELEVYAAGVRDLDKIMQLDHLLETVPGLRYKVDSNHDLVYLEFDEPASMTSASIRETFTKIGLKARFVGPVSTDLRPKTRPSGCGCEESLECGGMTPLFRARHVAPFSAGSAGLLSE